MIGLIAIIGIVTLIWGAVMLRYCGLLDASLGVLFVGTLFGPFFFSYDIGPLPLTADRLLLAAVVGIYLIGRSRGSIKTKPLGASDFLLASVMIVLTISTLTHNWRIDEAQPLASLLFYFAMPATVYWISREAKLDKSSISRAMGVFVVLGLYLSVTAVAEVRGVRWLVFPQYIASPLYQEFLGRARGPFLNPIASGIFLTAGLGCLGAMWPSGGRRTMTTWLVQVVLALIGLVVLAGIYFTMTRSVWLSAAITLFFIGAVHLPRSKRLPALALVSFLALGAVALNWESVRAFKRDRNVSVHAMAQSAGLRPILATIAYKMFRDRPLTGCGFGQYKEYDSDYLRDPGSRMTLERARPYIQHNVFLGLLTETGLLGAGLFTALLLSWTRDTYLLWRRGDANGRPFAIAFLAVLTAYCVNGMFHHVAIIPMVHMILFTMAGMTRGLVASRASVRTGGRSGLLNWFRRPALAK